MPLLGLEAAGIAQTPGISTGLISQNGNPPYAVPHQEVIVHWLETSPLRPSNIRAPGKIAQLLRGRELHRRARARGAARSGRIPAGGHRRSARHRGRAPRRRADRLAAAAVAGTGWRRDAASPTCITRTTRPMSRWRSRPRSSASTGAIRVRRVACAHDCGLVINPDALRAQIEGNILQTLSRTLFEEVQFDRARVTSVDWASYPILRVSRRPGDPHRPRQPAAASRRSARARRRPRRCPRRSAMRSSTRPASACARCRSRASACAPPSADRTTAPRCKVAGLAARR